MPYPKNNKHDGNLIFTHASHCCVCVCVCICMCMCFSQCLPCLLSASLMHTDTTTAFIPMQCGKSGGKNLYLKYCHRKFFSLKQALRDIFLIIISAVFWVITDPRGAFVLSLLSCLFIIVDDSPHWGTQAVLDPGNVLVFILIGCFSGMVMGSECR